MELRVGAEIDGMKLIEKVGRGGFGEVWRVAYFGTEKCAKFFDEGVATNVINVEALPQYLLSTSSDAESKYFAKVEHISSNPPYIRMEYVGKGDLGKFLKQGPLGHEAAYKISRQILIAMQYAHSKGFAHGDLKPSNILVTGADDPAIKVIDFGLGLLLDQNLPEDKLFISYAERTVKVGNPGFHTLVYSAPERASKEIQKKPDIAVSCDVYSFGKIYYQMLTGEIPYSVLPIAGKIMGVKPALEQLIFRCVSNDWKNRPSAMKDILAALDQVYSVETKAPEKVDVKIVIPGRVAGFSFKSGEVANTVDDLKSLAAKNMEESIEHLYGGDFEKWLYEIGEDETAEAARKIRETCPDRYAGIYEFIHGKRPFISRDGQVLHTVEDVFTFCTTHSNLARHHLYNGDFAGWFRHIGKQELVERADYAVRVFPSNRPLGQKVFTDEPYFNFLKGLENPVPLAIPTSTQIHKSVVISFDWMGRGKRLFMAASCMGRNELLELSLDPISVGKRKQVTLQLVQRGARLWCIGENVVVICSDSITTFDTNLEITGVFPMKDLKLVSVAGTDRSLMLLTDSAIVYLDPSNLEVRKTIQLGLKEAMTISISRDGSLICVGTGPGDGNSIVTFGPDGVRLRIAKGAHTDAVRCIGVSADKKFIVTGGQDCMVRVWDSDTLEKLDSAKIDDDSSPIRIISTHNLYNAYCVGVRNNSYMMHVGTRHTFSKVSVSESAVRKIRFSEDGQYMAVNDISGIIRIFRLTSKS